MGIRQESKQQYKFCGILFRELCLGHIFVLKYTLSVLTKSFLF